MNDIISPLCAIGCNALLSTNISGAEKVTKDDMLIQNEEFVFCG